MASGSIAEDFVMAAPAELLWKAAFSHDATTLTKAYAGMVDDVEINGDGKPGSLTTMKFNPAGIPSNYSFHPRIQNLSETYLSLHLQYILQPDSARPLSVTCV
jgi:hypothetical protein